MKPSSNSDHKRNQLLRYQLLIQHRQHVERIFWSRIQVLHLIQAAVIGGSFYVIGQKELPNCFSYVLLGLGIILTITLFILCKYDWKSAEVNKNSLYNLGDALGIRWAPERPHITICGHRMRISGHRILYFVVILFIPVDILLLVLL